MTHMLTSEYAVNGSLLQFTGYNNTIHAIQTSPSTLATNLSNRHCLPEDGIPEGLLEVDNTDTSDSPDESDEADDDSRSFLPFPMDGMDGAVSR